MSTDAAPAEPTPPQPTGQIVARAGTYYRVTRYLMTFILIGYGIWSLHDGFYAWQPENWERTHPHEKDKTPADIMVNEGLGLLLPPLGIFVLVWALRNSRGEYRLQDGVLHAPGHPPIPLNRVQTVDKKLWDRKGIAFIEYKLDSGAVGEFDLDDFVYQREPIDKIFEQIEAALLKAPAAAVPASVATVPGAGTAPSKPAVPAAPRMKTPPRPKLGQY